MAELPPEYAASFTSERPIEIRPVDPMDIFHPEKRPPQQMCWMKARDRCRTIPVCTSVCSPISSDWSLLDTATLPHAVSFTQTNMQVASLDHAMWFHRPFGPTNGCSTSRTARAPQAPAGSIAD